MTHRRHAFRIKKIFIVKLSFRIIVMKVAIYCSVASLLISYGETRINRLALFREHHRPKPKISKPISFAQKRMTQIRSNLCKPNICVKCLDVFRYAKTVAQKINGACKIVLRLRSCCPRQIIHKFVSYPSPKLVATYVK